MPNERIYIGVLNHKLLHNFAWMKYLYLFTDFVLWIIADNSQSPESLLPPRNHNNLYKQSFEICLK